MTRHIVDIGERVRVNRLVHACVAPAMLPGHHARTRCGMHLIDDEWRRRVTHAAPTCLWCAR